MTERIVGDANSAIRAGLPGEHTPPPRADRTGDQAGGQPEPKSSASDALWDVAGVAAFLSIPIASIYKMTARKAAVRIPHIRIGGHLRFRRSDVEQWLTLLTVSNLTTLSRMRETSRKTSHGDHS